MEGPPLQPTDDQKSARRRPTWPPDGRRRLVVAVVAALVVFAITFEAARMAQGDAVAYRAGGIVWLELRRYQEALDEHVAATGAVPAALADVPSIGKELDSDPDAASDSWGTPYQLVTREGKPTILSLGRDRAPGGRGIDADVTARGHLGGGPRLTLRQFIELAPLPIILVICTAAAAATAILTFQAPAKPPPAHAKLHVLLLTALVTGAASVVVGFFMAVTHAPSGH